MANKTIVKNIIDDTFYLTTGIKIDRNYIEEAILISDFPIILYIDIFKVLFQDKEKDELEDVNIQLNNTENYFNFQINEAANLFLNKCTIKIKKG